MLAVTPYSTHFVTQIVDVSLSLLARSIKLIFGFVIFSPALVYRPLICIEISRTNYLVVNFIFSNFIFAIFFFMIGCYTVTGVTFHYSVFKLSSHCLQIRT